METETMTDAQRVAADHADTLQRFGEWLEMFGDGSPTRADVAALADDDDADTDDRAAARAALAWMDENGADDLSWSAFAMGFLDCEISGRFDSDLGEWYVTGVAALVTCGGPNVRYHSHGAGTIRVSVSWWSDRADRVIDSGLADYLDDFATDVSG